MEKVVKEDPPYFWLEYKIDVSIPMKWGKT